jgi:soluble lytic murein transglycosylase-like protein
MLKTLIAILFFAQTYFAHAGEKSPLEINNCWLEAGARYHIDPWLLYSVAWVESRHNSKALNWNKNGTVDMGMMQINSIHLTELEKYGITSRELADPCMSIHVGAWILSQNFQRIGFNWQAIGAYNAGAYMLRLKYATKVYAAYRHLTKKALEDVILDKRKTIGTLASN